MQFSAIQLNRVECVAVVTINAPPANAFTENLISEMTSILEQLNIDDSVRAVLLESANKRIFLSGGDIRVSLNAINKGNNKAQLEYVRSIQMMVEKLYVLGKPTVASIDGHAIGGGFEFLMACDFRLASDSQNIKLGMPEVDLGFIPALGGMAVVSRKFGEHLALKMGYGERFNTKRAFELGLVDGLYPQEDLRKESMALVKKLAALPTKAIGMIKKILTEVHGKNFMEINELELSCLSNILETDDVKEGLLAFVEHREPHFKGR